MMHLKRAAAAIAAAATAFAGLAIGAVGASAADTGNIDQATTQAITITNAEDGTTFAAYQLATFINATTVKDTAGDGDQKTIETLQMTTPEAANTALKTAIETLNSDADASGWSEVKLGEPYVYADADNTPDNLGALVATLSDMQVRALAEQLAKQVADGTDAPAAAGTAGTAADAKATISGLVPGWYLVLGAATGDAAKSVISPAIVPSTVPGYASFARKSGGNLVLGQVVAKHKNKPDVQKTNNLADQGKHTVGIGDVIPYTITTKLAGASTEDGNVTYQRIADRPGKGLTVTAVPATEDDKATSLVVKVKDQVLDPKDYTLVLPPAQGAATDEWTPVTGTLTVVGDSDDNGNGTGSFGVDLTAYAQAHPELAGSDVTVTYYGTVNSDAVDHVTNLVGLDANDPQGYTEMDKAYLGKFEFTKVGVDEKDAKGLAGAGFQVTDADGTVLSFVDNGNGTYTYLSSKDEATAPVQVITTPQGDGATDRGHVTVLGVPEGTYTLKETVVPNTYSSQFVPEFDITVSGTQADKPSTANVTKRGIYGLASQDGDAIQVKNVKSVTQLPLTGAAGIGMLLVAALLLGGAAALIALRTRSLKRQLR